MLRRWGINWKEVEGSGRGLISGSILPRNLSWVKWKYIPVAALRRWSAAARLLGLWVRNPRGHRCLSLVSVVLGRCLCVGLITRPEESYRLWCDWVWSWILDNKETLTHWGLLRHGTKKSGRIGKASVSWDLNPIPPDSSVLRLFKYGPCVLWHCRKIQTCFNLLSGGRIYILSVHVT